MCGTRPVFMGSKYLREAMKENYGMESKDEIVAVSEFYRYYGLIAAYKQNNLEVWLRLHIAWPISNDGDLVQKHPGEIA